MTTQKMAMLNLLTDRAEFHLFQSNVHPEFSPFSSFTTFYALTLKVIFENVSTSPKCPFTSFVPAVINFYTREAGWKANSFQPCIQLCKATSVT